MGALLVGGGQITVMDMSVHLCRSTVAQLRSFYLNGPLKTLDEELCPWWAEPARDGWGSPLGSGEIGDWKSFCGDCGPETTFFRPPESPEHTDTSRFYRICIIGL